MVKIYWLASALVVGIALGLFIGQLRHEETAATAPPREAGIPHAEVAARHAPDQDHLASRKDPQPIVAFAPSDSVVLEPAMPPATITSTPSDPSGAIAFTIENAPPGFVPGPGTPVVTMHDQFLREVRDDSWAYLREAEIENALQTEFSMGKFRKDRIECRATICEMDLSGRGETEIAALKKWYEEFAQFQHARPSSTLDLRSVMFSQDSENGKATASVVYMRPQPLVPPPN